MAWRSGSSARSCLELFWETKSAGRRSAISLAPISALVGAAQSPSSQGSGTGCDQPRPTLGCCQDSWCRCLAWHGMALPHQSTLAASFAGSTTACLFTKGWDATLSCCASHWLKSFLVNGRLSTVTFQRRLRAPAIFYLLGWTCRLLRG